VAWSIDDLREHLLIGSTLVEGSTLSEGEARDVLAGRTVAGHSVREIRELANYQLATEWLMDCVQHDPMIAVEHVLGYHARLMHGLDPEAGRFKTHRNYTIRSDGSHHEYGHPALVPEETAEWVAELNASSMDPVGHGARVYARFQAIHPFADGNGRIGRVLLAYYLHRNGGFSFRFYASDKLDHLRAIEATNHGDLAPLEEFIRARIAR
jgi:Fic family protein